jgi:hypothetical protein
LRVNCGTLFAQPTGKYHHPIVSILTEAAESAPVNA